MSTNVGNSPELLTEIVQRILIQPLQEASVFLNSGVRIFDTDGSPVRVPKLGALSNPPTFVTETGTIPTNLDQNFDEVRLLERTIMYLAGISTFSEALLRQSVINVEAAIRDSLVTKFASTIDAQFFAGTSGSGTTPEGLLNWAGTQNITAVGVPTNFDPFIDALGLALAASVDPSRLQWFMRPESFTRISKLKDGQDRYQLQPDPTIGGKFKLLGFPVTVTKKLPIDATPTPDTCPVVLADMSTVAVARDRAAEVKRLDQLYAETQRIGLRVITRMDVAPLLPEAIIVMRDVAV